MNYGLKHLIIFLLGLFYFSGFAKVPAPLLLPGTNDASYTMYNAKTGTLLWTTSSDWIRNLTGTIAYPNGAAGATITVTGTGTAFNTDLSVGNVILLQSAPGSSFGTVQTISSATSMTVQLTSAVGNSSGINYGKQATPSNLDDVIITNPNIAVAATDAQVNTAGAQIRSLTINANAANISVTINSNYDLTIINNISISQTTTNGTTNYLNVNAGTLNVNGSINLGTHNSTSGYCEIVITTGIFNSYSDLNFKAGNYTRATLRLTSSGRFNLYGNITYTDNTNVGQILSATNSIFNFCSSSVTQYLYTGWGGNSTYFNYGKLYCNNTSSGGLEMNGTGNHATQIIDLYIQSGKFLNKLTSGKLVGNGAGSVFSISNGAVYETFGLSSNSDVPETTFGVFDLQPNSTVKYHTRDNPFFNHVTYGNVELSPSVACGFYMKDATPYTILGNLTIGDGTVAVSFLGQAATTVNISGNLLINPNGTFNCNTKNIDVNIGGNWTNNGTYQTGTNIVTYNGTSTQTITKPGGESYYSLTVNNTYNGGYSVLLNNPINISNIFTLTDGIVKTSSTNLLTVLSTGSATSGSSQSFVEGPMTKQAVANGASFVFPVGKGTRWRRAEVSAIASGPSDFTAEYYDTGYGNYNVLAPLDHVSTMEYWVLSKSAGAAAAKVRLYWEDAGASIITNCTDLTIAHWNGTSWEEYPGTASGTCTGAGAGSVVMNNTNTVFSPFTFGSKSPTSNPLPVELSVFNAEKCDTDVCLKWTTLSEKNNDSFTIEKSKDGVSFDVLAKIKGAGTSNSKKDYSYTDKHPFGGSSYYRLKQTDYNGQYSFSDHRMVNLISVDDFSIGVYPNPNNGSDFSFALISDESMEILVVVYDINGKESYSKVLLTESSGQTVFAVDPYCKLAPGIYLITATSKQVNYHKRMVVQ